METKMIFKALQRREQTNSPDPTGVSYYLSGH